MCRRWPVLCGDRAALAQDFDELRPAGQPPEEVKAARLTLQGHVVDAHLDHDEVVGDFDLPAAVPQVLTQAV
jgi:hypothetical protein